MSERRSKSYGLDTVSHPAKADMVLYDVDGVLVNFIFSAVTQSFQMLVLEGKNTEPGQDFAKIFQANSLSGDPNHIIPYLLDLSPSEWESDKARLLKLHKAIFEQIAPGTMFAYDGAPEMVADTAKVKKTGAITMRNRYMMTPDYCGGIITPDKPNGDFDLVITKDDVSQPKPSPEGVLRACHEMEISPTKTVLVGDMKTDMMAARAAGAYAVGIVHETIVSTQEELYAAGANYVVGSFSELRELLNIPGQQMI